MKNFSLKSKLLLLVISSILFVSVLYMIESAMSLKNNGEKSIKQYQDTAYKLKNEELKNYVSLVIHTIESFHTRTNKENVKTEVQDYLKEQTDYLFSILNAEYNAYKDVLSEEELKKRLKLILNNAKFGKEGYFFGYKDDGVCVIHGAKKSLIGKNLSNVKDKNGKYIIKELIQIGKSSKAEGVMDYYWSKPNSDETQMKVSYIKTFKPYGWIIGTGEYLDNVTEKIKQEALNEISKMQYGKDGYFWINDSNHTVVMHPLNKSLEGKNLENLKDKNGKFVYKEIVRVANDNKEGGFVNYMWDKPGKSTPQPKISFVKKFEEWDWIVGTGVYADDIEDNIAMMREETNNDIKNAIIKEVIIILVITILISLIMVWASNKIIIKPIKEFENGILNFFKYLNKETKEVEHLKINSNDEIGKMSEVVNTNIDKTKSLIDQDTALIDDVTKVVEEIRKGYLNKRVEKNTDNESLQKLQTKINEMLNNLESNIGKDINIILAVLSNYSKLDFRDNIQNANGKVEIAINDLSLIINNMLKENKENGLTLDESSNILLTNVDTLNKNSTETAAALEETAAALEEITSTIVSNTENISKMSNYANDVSHSVEIGKDLALSTVKSMDEINDQTQAIAEAITVIDQIAFQTNILSLNAAVEAATAGEAGKGFAVVAQEVRNLASRSAEAAKEIKDLVESATNKTNLGKDSSDKMIEGYQSLNESINKTTEIISHIAEAAKEQRAGIEQINDAVNQLDKQTQENVAISNTTHYVAEQTDEIAKLVVSSADEKEFIGKDSVKAKKLDNKASSNFELKRKEGSRLGITKSTDVEQKIIVDNSSDDQWDSF